MNAALPYSRGSGPMASVAAVLSRARSFAVHTAKREGRIRLMPGNGHQLQLELPLGTLVLNRDDCAWLKQQLGTVPEFRHLVQVELPASGANLTDEDAAWVLRAIAQFERELEAEDRRSSDRLHPALPIRVEA